MWRRRMRNAPGPKGLRLRPRSLYIRTMTATKRSIEIDSATAAALEARAAETGVSVSDLLAGMVAPVKATPAELSDLDRQWSAIKAGEPTVSHDSVVRWLDTWGKPAFKPWAGR